MTTLIRSLVVLAAVPLAQAAPPLEVAVKLRDARTALDRGHFTGSYTMTTLSTVAKPDGSSAKSSEMVMEVENPPEGVQRRHLVRFVENGEDRTEETREELETVGDGDDDEDFLVPFGENAHRFTFAPPREVDGHLEASFEPAPGHAEDEGITRGAVAWDPSSLDPLWMELDVLDPPTPLRELVIRLEYQRRGDHTYLARMTTDGRVRILLMKRHFHMEMTITDLEPTGGG